MKTQEERLRYILNGGKLKRTSDGAFVGIKDGVIWDYADNRESGCILSVDEWEPHIEPMKVEFECEWELSENENIIASAERDPLVYQKLKQMVGNGKFKVTCEQIIEESK